MKPRHCDNPHCDNVVPSIRGWNHRIGNNVFCGETCKVHYLLWVEAVARQQPAIGVRPLYWGQLPRSSARATRRERTPSASHLK
jgi:hypothetical protein